MGGIFGCSFGSAHFQTDGIDLFRTNGCLTLLHLLSVQKLAQNSQKNCYPRLLYFSRNAQSKLDQFRGKTAELATLLAVIKSKCFLTINYYVIVKVEKSNSKEVKKRLKNRNLLLVMKRQAGIDKNNFVKELRRR